MDVTGSTSPKINANAITWHEQKKKNCPIQHLSVINNKKHKIETLLSYPILCPLCHLHKRKQIKTELTQLKIYFNVAGQVNIVKKKASTKQGHLISQVHNTAVTWYIKPWIFRTKQVSKASRQKLVEWTMKK